MLECVSRSSRCVNVFESIRVYAQAAFLYCLILSRNSLSLLLRVSHRNQKQNENNQSRPLCRQIGIELLYLSLSLSCAPHKLSVCGTIRATSEWERGNADASAPYMYVWPCVERVHSRIQNNRSQSASLLNGKHWTRKRIHVRIPARKRVRWIGVVQLVEFGTLMRYNHKYGGDSTIFRHGFSFLLEENLLFSVCAISDIYLLRWTFIVDFNRSTFVGLLKPDKIRHLHTNWTEYQVFCEVIHWENRHLSCWSFAQFSRHEKSNLSQRIENQTISIAVSKDKIRYEHKLVAKKYTNTHF